MRSPRHYQYNYTNFYAPAGTDQVHNPSSSFLERWSWLVLHESQTSSCFSSISPPNISLAYMHSAQRTHNTSKMADINSRQVTQNIWYETQLKLITYNLDTDKSHSGAPPGGQTVPNTLSALLLWKKEPFDVELIPSEKAEKCVKEKKRKKNVNTRWNVCVKCSFNGLTVWL